MTRLASNYRGSSNTATLAAGTAALFALVTVATISPTEGSIQPRIDWG